MVIKRIKVKRRNNVEGEISAVGHTCTPVESLLAVSHLLRHSTIYLVTQSRISSGIRAEKYLGLFHFQPAFTLGR